jgi:hypothetical protein
MMFNGFRSCKGEREKRDKKKRKHDLEQALNSD